MAPELQSTPGHPGASEQPIRPGGAPASEPRPPGELSASGAPGSARDADAGEDKDGREADVAEISRWRTLIEQSPNMVVVTNRRREICWVNQAFVEFTGWTLDEIAGSSPRRFLHGPRTHRGTLARLRRLLDEGGSVTDFEVLNYKKSGELYWVSLNIRPIVDQSGAVVEYVSIQTDITGRKRREAEIERTQRRLAQAHRLARLGWLEHELASGRVVCSPEVAKVFGLAAGVAEIPMAELTRFTHPEDAERVRSEYAHAINTGADFVSEHRMLTPAGEVRWVRMRGMLEGWEDGRPAVFRLVAQDMTERREAERAARDKEAFERASRSQTETLARLTEKLRAPLQAMLGFTEMIERQEGVALSTRGRAHLQRIRAAGQGLLHVVDDIGDLVDLRASDSAFACVPVDLTALAVEVAAQREPAATTRRIAVVVEPAPGRAIVISEPWRLRQLLTHLFGHAIQCGRDGARIQVTIEPAAGGSIRLGVRDRDGWSSAACLPHLFEPFARACAGEADDDGNGLRLAICQALVERMGGSIAAESGPDAGIALIVLLPAPAESVVPIGRAAAAVGDRLGRGKTRCVLCVDEDVVSNVLVEGLLQRRADLAPRFRRLGAEGLSAARELRPDLVLVALQLPDMTGFEFLKQIRSDAVLRRVPCVALSADTRDETVDAAVRAGFRDFLCKPAALADLLNVIDRLVQS